MNSVKIHEKNASGIRLEQLAALYAEMMENGDSKNATKLLELWEKHKNEEMYVTFAGHFSAGKSSMINAILGEEILPKSPIPTSANVVKISSGGGVARVFFTSGDPAEYKEPYDIDMIKEYSKDKEAISRIEIDTGAPIVPERTAIIDTPGIDAADDADRLMTEASLHLADVLFYVMDYNHVQSEVNLQFLKSIQEKSIPYHVVINQIDKHDEKELSFMSFAESIKQTFDQWSLTPENIYYSSLLKADAPHNQFDLIRKKLFKMMTDDRQEHIHNAISALQVMEEHRDFLEAKYGSEIDRLSGDVAPFDPSQWKMVKEKRDKLKDFPQRFQEEFLSEVQRTLNNAYMMPAELRDKAQSFLEATQPDFKVGLFSSKKKTKQEREQRENDFLLSLKESIKSSVQWKLRDKCIAILKEYGMEDGETLQKVNHMEISLHADDLQRLTKSGAKMSGDYVLHYTNDVAADIKRKFKEEAIQLMNLGTAHLKEKYLDEMKELEVQLEALESARKTYEEALAVRETLNQKINELEMAVKVGMPDASVLEMIEEELSSRPQPIRRDSRIISKGNLEEADEIREQDKADKGSKVAPTEKMIADIDETLKLIEGVRGFDSLKNDLTEKKHRLSNRSYTIALFGAFSAGKSSFANALIGEKVLPVSPNPTTATVNRIRPVTEVHRHGTAYVTLKKEETLVEELKAMTSKFSPTATRLADMVEWIRGNNIQEDEQLSKMYQSFLQAILSGYPMARPSIGSAITVDIDEFESYVTDESKACYIESIDLYYDCPITRQGITLVDTPGADSVNARHTNVAFEYIKHADAILYVTYYNHALSRADKDFLMQLGRVKEAFQLDKMFFIVNAADLAADEEELAIVTDYVTQQLQQLGIRLPNLYPVSSKGSLAEKLNKRALNQQMQQFEDEFYRFIHNDLASLTVESACLDIRRTYQAMRNFVDSLNLDEGEKEKRKQLLLDRKAILSKDIEEYSTEAYKVQVDQKMDKQLHYVLERLSIRFHDMFKDVFNPTTIRDSGSNGRKQLLQSLENLIEYVGFELHQELQAVSLRMESFIRAKAGNIHKSLAEMAEVADGLFSLPTLEAPELSTPEYTKGLQIRDLKAFDKALSTFKGTKAFFEKNEKEKMKEMLYDIIDTYAKSYIDENKQMMAESYSDQWQQLVTAIKRDAKAYIEGQMGNYLEILVGDADIPALTNTQNRLYEIVKQYE